MGAAQQGDEAVLRAIGVLVFVDENELKARSPRLEPLGIVLQDSYGELKQIVEVSRVIGAKGRLQGAVYLRRGPAHRITCNRGILVRRDERILGIRD